MTSPSPNPDAASILQQVLRTQDMVVSMHGDVLTAEALEEAVKRGIVEGIKSLAKDEEFTEAFWKSGYEHLTSRVGDGATKWIGRKVVLWVGGVLVAVGLYLAGKAGLLK